MYVGLFLFLLGYIYPDNILVLKLLLTARIQETKVSLSTRMLFSLSQFDVVTCFLLYHVLCTFKTSLRIKFQVLELLDSSYGNEKCLSQVIKEIKKSGT